MVDAIPPASAAVSTASVAAVLTIAPGTAQPTPVSPTPPDDDSFGPAVVVGPSARPTQFVVYDSQGRLTASIPPSDANPPPPPAQLPADPSSLPPSLIYLR